MISRCTAFVGARTHSTIAAISSGVATLSLAYSRKARGLNQDLFGSQEHCLPPSEISPAAVAEHVVALLAQRDAIRDHLSRTVAVMREIAFRTAGSSAALLETK